VTLEQAATPLIDAYEAKAYDVANLDKLQNVGALAPDEGCGIALEFVDVLASMEEERKSSQSSSLKGYWCSARSNSSGELRLLQDLAREREGCCVEETSRRPMASIVHPLFTPVKQITHSAETPRGGDSGWLRQRQL
jgi:hypothetical protein